ncbi:MAG: GNAT family N-acetyltransferase [Paracoccaceae bacterium]
MTPNGETLLAAVDVTWPAARTLAIGPWRLREGLGGGQRVSAASAQGPVSDADLDTAIDGMARLKQPPLFMIGPKDGALDTLLNARAFEIKDPVTVLIAPVTHLVNDLPSVAVTPSWPPLAVQREIWDRAGVNSARLDVMERVQTVKTSHLGRNGDIPAGTAFTALSGDLAMLHALEVDAAQKRSGVGRNIMIGAANWAANQGATWLAVLVVNANQAANAFYTSLGMVNSGFGYHYRSAPKGTA